MPNAMMPGGFDEDFFRAICSTNHLGEKLGTEPGDSKSLQDGDLEKIRDNYTAFESGYIKFEDLSRDVRRGIKKRALNLLESYIDGFINEDGKVESIDEISDAIDLPQKIRENKEETIRYIISIGGGERVNQVFAQVKGIKTE